MPIRYPHLLWRQGLEMKNSNVDLVRFCIGKVGVPYVMGTNGRILAKAALDDLIRRNPGKWFTSSRMSAVRSWIGKRTTDCHGLIEWFMAELAGGKWTYDVTADGAFHTATVKGSIGSIPELPGVCVRYKGHVGVYIGGRHDRQSRARQSRGVFGRTRRAVRHSAAAFAKAGTILRRAIYGYTGAQVFRALL